MHTSIIQTLWGFFVQNCSNKLYAYNNNIMGWDDPDYRVECSGAPFQKSHM